MSSVKPSHLAALLRSQAEAVVKSAASSTGAPSTADGVAEVKKGTIPTDPGEAELKKDLPTDGTAADDTNTMVPGENLNPSGTPAADKGAPAEAHKCASARVSAIRGALLSVLQPEAATTKAAAAPAAVADPAAAPAGTEPAKSASAPEGGLDLSHSALIKLAKAVLATNEGVAFAQYTMEKAAGAEHADEMIKAAKAASVAHDETLFSKQAAFNEGMTKAAAIHRELSQMITEEDADSILKQASLHCENMEALEHPMLKAAYAAGVDDAAALEEGAEAGAAEPAIPGGGEQLSMEDVVALLQEMIASGEITEEEVIAGLQELQGAGDPAAAVDPAADPAAAVDPAAAAAPVEDPAAAVA